MGVWKIRLNTFERGRNLTTDSIAAVVTVDQSVCSHHWAFSPQLETGAGFVVRITDGTGHGSHVKVDTDSGTSWTPVPRPTGP